MIESLHYLVIALAAVAGSFAMLTASIAYTVWSVGQAIRKGRAK